MSEILQNVALVLLFVIIGGVFAGAEMALVSLRESQVQALAERGRRGARVSKLAEDPNRFLSTVQIGVTLAGFLSAAFGAATLAEDVTPWLTGLGVSQGVASPLATVVITLVISYFSLVLGELAPKRVALQRSVGVSLVLAPALDRMAQAARPVIWLLSQSTNVVVRLLGSDPRAGRGEEMSDEEVRALVTGHESLTSEERSLVSQVFGAAKQQVRELMVPRTEVEFLHAAAPIHEAATEASATSHSRFPAIRNSQDDIVGFVHVRDLLDPALGGDSTRVAEVVRPVKLLPASKRVLPALSEMRREGHHLAIVVDEYGGTAGILTLEDLVEDLVGDIRDEYDQEQAGARLLRGGVLDVDALLNLADFAHETGITLPEGPYETVAGYIMATLGHVPGSGESVEVDDHRITVTEMDGRRVARVRVVPLPSTSSTSSVSSVREETPSAPVTPEEPTDS